MQVMPTLPFSAHHRARVRRVSRLVLLLAALCTAPAWSQSQPAAASTPASTPAVSATPPDFGAEHDRITSAKAWAEYRYAQTERGCYDKFFVTRCIDKAKDVRRTELHTIRERELALDEAGLAPGRPASPREGVGSGIAETLRVIAVARLGWSVNGPERKAGNSQTPSGVAWSASA